MSETRFRSWFSVIVSRTWILGVRGGGLLFRLEADFIEAFDALPSVGEPHGDVARVVLLEVEVLFLDLDDQGFELLQF